MCVFAWELMGNRFCLCQMKFPSIARKGGALCLFLHAALPFLGFVQKEKCSKGRPDAYTSLMES